jgi:transposase
MEVLPDLSQLSHEEKDALIIALWNHIQHLEERIKKLEDQLSKNSNNSSKPPSSDGFNKPNPKSLRQKGQRTTGGQPGHKGSQLAKHQNPDIIIYHTPLLCNKCGFSLADVKSEQDEARQVFDIPSLKIQVTEHCVEIKYCSKCQHRTTAAFPQGITQAAQYGERIKSLIIYLNHYQLLPYNRIREYFLDIFSHRISEGTIFNQTIECFEELAETEEQIKKLLQESPNLHCDESGIRATGKLHWCHVASTDKLTAFTIHPKRGVEAIDQMGILNHYRGLLIHDHFKPYWNYDTRHALCNAHHLRELTFIDEQHNQTWAKHMIDLLLAIKKQVAWHQEKNLSFLPARIEAYERCYFEIINQGLWHPDNILFTAKKKRGLQKQSKAKNLLDRLRHHHKSTLAFMYDFSIPFDNNQAERDIRMLKVKQKISGCFRSFENGQRFCRIRSYLSTAKKNGKQILQAIEDVFRGTPFVPQLNTV